MKNVEKIFDSDFFSSNLETVKNINFSDKLHGIFMDFYCFYKLSYGIWFVNPCLFLNSKKK